MWTIQRILIIVLSIALCAPAMAAQDRQQDAKGGIRASQEVTIIIEQRQVQFMARAAVEWMQLQVFNSSGETVFDSGAVAAGEIKWPFQNGNDEAVKSGLYAYTLSIKEPDKEASGMRRGHLIVDRARERDGAKDRFWITSRDADTGAELSVAREEGVTVSSSSTNAERTVERSTGNVRRDAGGREIEAPQNQSDAGRNALEAASGAVGRIAKFVTASDLGDSVIAEQNGNIGIGTATPVSTLDVRGRVTLDPGAGKPVVLYTAAGGGEQNRFLELINSPTTPSASGLKAGGLLVADNYNFAQPGKNNLVVKGAIGIGTATPASELHIHGLGPFITFSTPSGANAYIQNAGGNLVFKPTGFGACCAAMVIQPNTGNVGIGTSSPTAKLHVEGAGAVQADIKSINDRAFLSLTSQINGQKRIWSVESGIYGNSGWFGIYDWQANKGRLAIDPAGLVYVDALKITGGADFSENFDVNEMTTGAGEKGAKAKLEAGMVVSIDPQAPGKLTLSARAYDRRVAGVISGAGGVKPGMMMSQAGTLADGQHPVALSGRVYVWADATCGAIKPGDLMTTSPTPGHAMKASSPAKAQGATLGKAMTGLTSGKGLVLVLVTLQ